MRGFTRWALFVFMLSICSLASADESVDAEREQLLEMLKLVETALNEKDFNRLLPLLEQDAVVVFLNGEVARGKDQVREFFEKVLGGSSAILEDYNTQAKVSAPARFVGDLAIADGTTKETFIFANGSEMEVDTLWTVTLVKDDGGWKVLQLHFSSHFFDNPMVAAVERKLFLFTGIALLIGFVIGYFVKRRRIANG